MTTRPALTQKDLDDIAHDLNNHLNVIFGYTQLLTMKLSSDAEAQSYIQELQEAVTYLRELSRKLSGHLPAVSRPV